jgi:predicted SpoU family rRNA methylase
MAKCHATDEWLSVCNKQVAQGLKSLTRFTTLLDKVSNLASEYAKGILKLVESERSKPMTEDGVAEVEHFHNVILYGLEKSAQSQSFLSDQLSSAVTPIISSHVTTHKAHLKRSKNAEEMLLTKKHESDNNVKKEHSEVLKSWQELYSALKNQQKKSTGATQSH